MNGEALKAEHKQRWLEPAGAPDRCWCEDNQWDDEGVEYVLATQLEAVERERDEADKSDMSARDLLNDAEAQVTSLQQQVAELKGALGINADKLPAETLFIAIQDAYLRGLDWGRKYGSTEAEELKASYDYADKTTAQLSTLTREAPQ